MRVRPCFVMGGLVGAAAFAGTAFGQACPNPDGGDCLTPTPGVPGCADEVCCNLVCDSDPFCCETEWDDVCVATAEALCNGGGGGDPPANDLCEDATPATLGDNAFTTIDAGTDGIGDALCLSFGTDQVFNDVWFTFTPAEDGDLTLSTCNLVDYDSRIALYESCDPTTIVACNDDGPGCAGFSSLLVTSVTGGTEYTIRVGGFADGATGSGILNLSLGAPCDTSCPKGAIVEAEACGDDTNGGCNSDPGTAFEDIAVGDAVCGTWFFDGGAGLRDTDWFRFELTESSIVTVNGNSSNEVSMLLGIVRVDCSAVEVALLPTCPAVLTSACLPAGEYFVVAAPDFVTAAACGTDAGEYNFTLTAEACELPPAPDNDLCADAIVIEEGTTPFTTIDALTDGPADCTFFGNPNIFNDVWYLYTPTCDGIATISTCNDADFDTKLALYEGDCGDGLIQVACNDDGPGCAGFSSILTAPVSAGVTYKLRVGGFTDGGFGSGNLTIGCALPCDTSCPDGAIFEDEECGFDENGGCNDGGAGTSVQTIAVGDTVCGTFFFDGGLRDTDWYEFTLDQDSIVQADLFTLDTIAGAVAILSTDCPPADFGFVVDSNCPTTVVSSCLPAGTYRLFVSLDFGAIVTCGDEAANYTVSLSIAEECDAGPPENDDCANAIEIFNGDTEFSTEFATTDGLEDPLCDSFGTAQINNDIWYTYTATCTDTLTVSTCNTVDFDTRIAVYEGTDCDPASIIACNDDGDGCAGFSSFLTTPVTEGMQYTIRIGAFGAGETGSGTVSVECNAGPQPPENDACEDAIAIGDGVTAFSTALATTDGVEDPLCESFGTAQIFNDVWFVYTASCDGLVTVSTCNDATFDTRIAAYTSCDPASIVACNDDGPDCAGFTSILEFEATCGETYILRVGAFGAAQFGEGNLSISCDGDCGQACVGDLNGDDVVNGADLTILLGEWNEEGENIADLNGDLIVSGADLTILLGAWGPCP